MKHLNTRPMHGLPAPHPLLLTSCLVLAFSVGGCAESPPVTESVPPLVAKVRDLRVEGHELLDRGEVDQARRSFEEARFLAESTGDRAGLILALNDEGMAWALQGAPAKAIDLHRRAHELARSLDRSDLAAESLASWGAATQQAGQLDHAKALYEEGLLLARRSGNRRTEAVLLNNLGLLQKQAGDLAAAQGSFQQALGINQELENLRGQAANLLNLGLVAEQAGRLEDAWARFFMALELDKMSEDRAAVAGDLISLARVAERQNRQDVAVEYSQRAYAAYRALGKATEALAALQQAAALVRRQGRESDALKLELEASNFKAATISADPPKP